MLREIGGEYWIERGYNASDKGVDRWLASFGQFALTSSGRSAIALMLQQPSITRGAVLIPAYTCASVLQPFLESGMKCLFYSIGEDLDGDVDFLALSEKISVFLHMGYFGFNTNVKLQSVIKRLKDEGAIIVEDVTHTMFSTHRRSNHNDYYVASLRKWFGLPSGGLLASPHMMLINQYNSPSEFVALRTAAMLKKADYILNPDPNLKASFRELFYRAETALNADAGPYLIDCVSKEMLLCVDVEAIIDKRRANYTYLFDRLAGLNGLKPLGPPLDGFSTPFFFPVLVSRGRNILQQELAQRGIYCPVHWAAPSNLPKSVLTESAALYTNSLSLPCDQRYALQDMAMIVGAIEALI